MPAIHYDRCFLSKALENLTAEGEDENIYRTIYPNLGHKDDCSFKNKSHGKWRMYLASIRCYCPCHDPEPQFVIQEIP